MPSSNGYTIRGGVVNKYIYMHSTPTRFWCNRGSLEVFIKHVRSLPLSLDRFQPGLGTTLELLQIQAIRPVPFDSCQHENATNLSETRG